MASEMMERRNRSLTTGDERSDLRATQVNLEDRMFKCHNRLMALKDTRKMLSGPGARFRTTVERIDDAVVREQCILNEVMEQWLTLDEEIDGVKS